MTKVLHVIDRMDPQQGGVCQAVRTIVTGLQGLGVHNEIVSIDYPDATFLKTEPLIIHALGPAENAWSYNKLLRPWFKKHSHQFNVVIVHGLWQYPSYAIYITLKRLKIKTEPKLFVMPHGMLDPYFQRASGRKLKALRNILYWALIEKHVVNSAYGLLFTCESERNLAREPFKPYRPKRELVGGLGVEAPPTFTPLMATSFQEKCPALQKSSYILFLSRIHEKKGVDLLLNAYARLLKEASTTAIEQLPKLVIAGPGIETPYGKKIHNIVNQNSLFKNQVYFSGMLKGDAKWGGFYGCEAFILPSHQENFGIAVVEALACSKPVLISNQVNIWTEIQQAGGGIINTDTEAGTYSNLNKFLLMNSFERASMNSNARICFEQYFAVGPATNNLLEAISS